MILFLFKLLGNHKNDEKEKEDEDSKRLEEIEKKNLDKTEADLTNIEGKKAQAEPEEQEELNVINSDIQQSSVSILIRLNNPNEANCKGRIPSKRMKGALELSKPKITLEFEELPGRSEKNLKRKAETYALSHKKTKFKFSI